MKIFNTSIQMALASLAPGQNVKTRGLTTLLDGGNAEYYIQSLADYGGVAPGSLSVDKSLINGAVAVKMASESVPQNSIVIYAGAEVDIPDGWNLCDGLNGTPDLRGNFVVGSGSTFTSGQSGGSSNITFPAITGGTAITEAQMPSHSHTTPLDSKSAGGVSDGSPTKIQSVGADSNASQIAYQLSNTKGGDETHTHSIAGNGLNANLPPYYALAYIMKTGVVGQVIQPIKPEGLATYNGVSGSVALDAKFGTVTVFEVTPNADITNLEVINLPTDTSTAYGCSIKIISDGTSLVTFDAKFNFEENTPPTLTLVAGSWDWLVAFSVDQGVTFDAKTSIGGLD